jgi:hypothetical protein
VVKALRYKLESLGIDSASKNEYQVNPGVKAAGA